MEKDPFLALRERNFRYFITVQFMFTVAILMQEVILGYYLYSITKDPLSLGLVGLCEAIPFIFLALFGGFLADAFDRRKIYTISFCVVVGLSLILAFRLDGQNPNPELDPWIIYSCIFFLGTARGFYSPAWGSLKPYLVKPSAYANSAAWSSQLWQWGRIVGPVLGGYLFAWYGLKTSLYAVSVIFILAACIAVSIPSFKKEKSKPLPIFQSINESIQFVRATPLVLYSLLLDMLSVLFGGVVAILPAFADDVLGVGERELGYLRAAPAVGAVITMMLTAFFTPTHKAWRNMLLAVLGFGVSTLIFAVSRNMPLACFALALTGAFDAISVVIRSTIMQKVPPEEMRGRVSSVNSVFISTSNELGAFESGLAAKYLGIVPSMIYGGVITLMTVGFTYLKTKGLLKEKF
ncbi:MAG: MFS transporter [Leadbetterella sp.]